MSLTSKYDKLNEGSSGAKQNLEEQTFIFRYDTPIRARNIYLTDLQQTQFVFSYMDVRMIEYSQISKKLIINFIAHTVELEGQNCDQLIEDLASGLIRKIIATDKRYNATQDTQDIIINTIKITSS